MEKQVFVAETDENGAVTCVWVNEPPSRSPRVFDPRLHSAKLDLAEVSGAPRNQIAAWVTSRENAAGAKHA